LKEAAARRGITITALIDESLELAGVRTLDGAEQILARAWARSRLSDDKAMALALEATAAVRTGAA
jgi:hypothetical protein